MKRILIVTQYIYPEPFKSTEMAIELVKRGYKVDVLTGIPNYPEGYYYKGYGLFSKRKEVYEGVTFYRCFQSHRKLLPGFLGISVNYVTFVISATIWVLLFFVWKKRYSTIITHEPSPITQIIPACILGDIRKVPVYSWIQDIWPDGIAASTGKLGKIIAPPLGKITNWVYRHSTKLLITSKGMAPLINRDADYSDKIIYYPQWSEDMMNCENKVPASIENVRGEDYTIMMVGSLNSAIGVPGILSLLEEMKDDAVTFVFVGGGSEEQNMRIFVQEKGLKNVRFTGRKPFAEMPYYYAQADAMLLTLKPTAMPHLDITIPARLQGYMSAGKPVLAMIGSGASEIISDANCGYSVPAGDYKSMAELIREKVLPHNKTLQTMGHNGREYFLREFTKEKCINHLCDIIKH